jgi:hypothetical protein
MTTVRPRPGGKTGTPAYAAGTGNIPKAAIVRYAAATPPAWPTRWISILLDIDIRDSPPGSQASGSKHLLFLKKKKQKNFFHFAPVGPIDPSLRAQRRNPS